MGWAGLVATRVLKNFHVTLEVLYGELEGTFPNHPADPIQGENLVDLGQRVFEHSSTRRWISHSMEMRIGSFSLTRGELLSGSLTTTIVAESHA